MLLRQGCHASLHHCNVQLPLNSFAHSKSCLPDARRMLGAGPTSKPPTISCQASPSRSSLRCSPSNRSLPGFMAERIFSESATSVRLKNIPSAASLACSLSLQHHRNFTQFGGLESTGVEFKTWQRLPPAACDGTTLPRETYESGKAPFPHTGKQPKPRCLYPPSLPLFSLPLRQGGLTATLIYP